MHNLYRRRLLKAALAGAGVYTSNSLFAQTSGAQEDAGALLRATKHALIIGNSQYKRAPLRNPANDARGIAAELKKSGFAVQMGTELSRDQMKTAIDTYLQGLARNKAVGLFYFAGHGVQLAWRNYLIPVDADIAQIEELRERAIDVNELIAGIRRAGNPMNLIILDACRDNPFGSIVRIDQKGLSQLDAPVGTLLAYATAPGNTAIDGEGEHGLYTEHLLREIRVPDAKVEDVFKRVRLGVRRQSKGQQIPWESTSLEQDFWFVPPQVLKKRVEAEIEREFRAELALWETIKSSITPEPLEDYLRRFPSGRFSELAQLQLDRLLASAGEKKIEVVSSDKNPYSKGSARADTAYKIGDAYFYRSIDLYTRLEQKPLGRRVTNITDTEVIFNQGAFVTDLLGNTLRTGMGGIWSPNQTVPTEFTVGKRWNTRYEILTPKGVDGILDLDMHVADRDHITVPAGQFNAFRVEARGWRITTQGPRVAVNWKTWYAPDQVRQPVASELLNIGEFGTVLISLRNELVKFWQQ